MRAARAPRSRRCCAALPAIGPRLPLAGVIFNRVASERHRALLAGAVARHLPDLADSRRAARRPGAGAAVAPSRPGPGRRNRRDRDGHRARRRRRSARLSTSIGCCGWRDPRCSPASPLTAGIPPLGRRIAVARDDAFCFTYPALLDGWRRARRRARVFLAARRRAARPRAPTRSICRAAIPSCGPAGSPPPSRSSPACAGPRPTEKPVYGECGGYMVLGEALIDADGRRHPMAGLLPLVTSFAERRLSLGYRRATLLADGPLGRRRRGLSRPRIPLCDGDPTKARPTGCGRWPMRPEPISAGAGCGGVRYSARSST